MADGAVTTPVARMTNLYMYMYIHMYKGVADGAVTTPVARMTNL